MLKTGHKTRFWCCQDISRKQKTRPSQKEGVKHRDTVGMKHFDCHSTLVVSCCQRTPIDVDQWTLSIHIEHHDSHTPYFDITMPVEATEIIRDNLEWSILSTLVPRIQGLFPNITSKQVHSAWSCMSQILWKKDENQLTSAKLLLDELAGDVDIFDIEEVDGVEQVCWGMKRIAKSLHKNIIEIALDATCE
jgi:hypothetical protein